MYRTYCIVYVLHNTHILCVCTVCIWRCEHKVLCGGFCAPCINSAPQARTFLRGIQELLLLLLLLLSILIRSFHLKLSLSVMPCMPNLCLLISSLAKAGR